MVVFSHYAFSSGKVSLCMCRVRHHLWRIFSLRELQVYMAFS